MSERPPKIHIINGSEEPRPLMSALENLRMQSKVEKPSGVEQAGAQDDPHDAWSPEAFGAYQAKTEKPYAEKMADLRKVIEGYYGKEHSLEPDLSEDAPAQVETKEKKLSMREQMTITQKEVEAAVAHLGSPAEFMNAERSRGKKEKPMGEVIDLSKHRKRRKAAAVGAMMGALVATDKLAAENESGPRPLPPVASKLDLMPLAPLEAPAAKFQVEAIKGKGYERMVQEIHDRYSADLRAAYPDLTKAPEDVQMILSQNVGKAAHQLALKYGMDKSKISLGATLTLTSKGTLEFTQGARVGRASRGELSTRELNERQITANLNRASLEASRASTAPEPPAEMAPQEVPPAMQSAVAEEATFPESVEVGGIAYGLSPESFTNRHGLTIDPLQAALFADRDGHIAVYGGDFEMRSSLAKSYIDTHPGSVVRIEVSEGGKQYVGEYGIDMRTGAQRIQPADEPPEDIGLFGSIKRLFRIKPTIDRDAFTKKIEISNAP